MTDNNTTSHKSHRSYYMQSTIAQRLLLLGGILSLCSLRTYLTEMHTHHTHNTTQNTRNICNSSSNAQTLLVRCAHFRMSWLSWFFGDAQNFGTHYITDHALRLRFAVGNTLQQKAMHVAAARRTVTHSIVRTPCHSYNHCNIVERFHERWLKNKVQNITPNVPTNSKQFKYIADGAF